METLPDDLIYIQPRFYLKEGGFILEIFDGMTPDEVRRRLR